MGGNLVLKLAGEWGSNAPPEFRAVAAVCPAMDLAASADALHAPGNRLYESYFLWNLRRRLREKARLFPDSFDPARLQGIRSLRDFDERVTAYYCGFQGADDYYAQCSAANVVDRIAVPAMILQAVNDPFIRIRPATRAKVLANPHIQFVETSDGGHCSFVGRRENRNAKQDGYWAESRVVDFLQQHLTAKR
jgi:predicted alpha/beta-fold hydrolase